MLSDGGQYKSSKVGHKSCVARGPNLASLPRFVLTRPSFLGSGTFQAGPVLGLPSPAYIGYPVPVVVPLPGVSFPANFTNTDLVTMSAQCNLQGFSAPAATYLPSYNDSGVPALSCTVMMPYYYTWQTSWTLTVSLNGQNFVSVQQPISFATPNVTKYDGWNYLRSYNNPGEQLPASPGVCVNYTTGVAFMSAFLANISLSATPLLPAFNPSVQVYSANVSADVSQLDVTIIPGVLGSRIDVNGTLLQYGCANGTDCNNTATLRIPYAGLNSYTITVDSPNGLNQTVYKLSIYSSPAADICRRRPFAPQARAAACINGVATFAGPTTGGTRVGVHYPYGPLPSVKATYSSNGIFPGLKPPMCAFGETLTVGSYAWERDYITCYSPPHNEPGTVELRISFDGSTFTAAGLTFSYYGETGSPLWICVVRNYGAKSCVAYLLNTKLLQENRTSIGRKASSLVFAL